ncbi:MAG: PorT family protein, partial [Bacteroidetes bacterium]|nr:PorT family protein [Bacteroidota bacterium]
MKKIMLTALVAVITMVSTNAQNFGAKAGVNFASITGDETEDLDGRTSFFIGAVVEFEISDKFSFQPELLYSGQGAKSSYSSESGDVSEESVVKLDYLNIPLMAKYYVSEGFSIEAGPQVGFLLSAKNEYEYTFDGDTESETEDIKEEVSSIDFGLNFGVGYKLDSGLNFGA